jgi:hypothetical protein
MIRTIAEANWAISIIEDTETGQLSLQCMCGQLGMYPQRVALTDEESARFRRGALDIDQMVRDVCRESPNVADRLVPPIPPNQLE